MSNCRDSWKDAPRLAEQDLRHFRATSAPLRFPSLDVAGGLILMRCQVNGTKATAVDISVKTAVINHISGSGTYAIFTHGRLIYTF